jgi:P4 family phage/plasmid primase-like protien
MSQYTINEILNAENFLYKGANGYKSKQYLRADGKYECPMLKSNATKEEIESDLTKETASHIQVYLNYTEPKISVIDIDDETKTLEEINEYVKNWLGFIPPYTLSASKKRPHYYLKMNNYNGKLQDTVKCWKDIEGDLIQRLIVEKNLTDFYFGEGYDDLGHEGLEHSVRDDPNQVEDIEFEFPSVNFDIVKNNMKSTNLELLMKLSVSSEIKKKITKNKKPQNLDCSSLKKELSPKTKIAIEYLKIVNPLRFDDFQTWNLLLFVCNNLEIPYEIFDDISKKASGYNALNNKKIWDEHIPDDKRGLVGLTTIKEWAKEDNFKEYELLEINYNILSILKKDKSQESLASIYLTVKGDVIYYRKINEKSGCFYFYDDKKCIWLTDRSAESFINDIALFYKNLLNPEYQRIEALAKNKSKELENKNLELENANKNEVDDIKSQIRILKEEKKTLQEDLNLIKNIIETKTSNSGCEKGILDFLKGKVGQPQDFFKKFNENPYIFAFSNGILYDLKLKASRKITKEDYIIIHTGYEYREALDEEIKLAYDFIYNYFENEDMTKSLISAIACSLLGYNINEKFFVFTGKGANGKSTIESIIRETFGNFYYSLPHTQLTNYETRVSGANTNLCALVNKRCAMSQEPESNGETLKVGVIKQLTGNDLITTRENFGSNFTYKPQFTMFLSCNDIPKISKKDGGILRRMTVFDFPLQFTAETLCDVKDNIRLKDPKIKEKVNSDAFKYGFLHLLINCWNETNGIFKECLSIKKRTEEYMAEQNPIKEWFEEYYEISNDTTLLGSELYSHFKSSCKENISSVNFGKLLKELVKFKQSNGIKYFCKKRINDNSDNDDCIILETEL